MLQRSSTTVVGLEPASVRAYSLYRQNEGRRPIADTDLILADRASLARISAFIGHGNEDTKLPVEWANRADKWLSDLGIAHDTCLHPGDHGISKAMLADFTSWFDKVLR